ncbi:MAG TPA: sigma-54-dependent Fis family transcriptional regulator, partial [Thermoanaerobaculia bacterium]
MQAPWIAVSAAFGALGRAFLCLDDRFDVLHASSVLDDFLETGAARAAEGRPVEELLGIDLFGPAAPLRQALLASERREGWRATLRGSGTQAHRLV